jgi:hypothetical protein
MDVIYAERGSYFMESFCVLFSKMTTPFDTLQHTMKRLFDLLETEWEALRGRNADTTQAAIIRLEQAVLFWVEEGHDEFDERQRILGALWWVRKHPIVLDDLKLVFRKRRRDDRPDYDILATREKAYECVRDYWTQVLLWSVTPYMLVCDAELYNEIDPKSLGKMARANKKAMASELERLK